MDMDGSVEPQMEMEKIENENRYIRLRKIYKLTQLEMADLLGYKSRSNISDLEIGRVNPSMGKLKDFHALFGIDPSWLMGIIETPYTEETIASAEKASAELAKELSDDMENDIDLYSFYRNLYGKHEKEDYTLENRFHMLFMANYVIHVLYRVWGRHYKNPWPKKYRPGWDNGNGNSTRHTSRRWKKSVRNQERRPSSWKDRWKRRKENK